MLSKEDFHAMTASLPQVPLVAASRYRNRLTEMTTYVNNQLRIIPNINELIGGNPLQLMYDNHRHHGVFMASVFTLDSYQMLTTTLPWVYGTYHSRQFSYEYFLLELRSWIAAIKQFIPADHQAPLIAVYQWMIEQHDNLILLSQQEPDPIIGTDTIWLERKNAFLVTALRGDHRRCLAMAGDIVQQPDDIENFYLQVLQPVLYEVGILWGKNKISVAQEHLVSAIVTRVIVAANLVFDQPARYHSKAVVAACANEYHEIGALMIADILELDQWDVCYLGANVPMRDLLKHLRLVQPDVLAFSATMAFNISRVRDTIGQIRQDPGLTAIKVIVGGKVFSDNPELWRKVGADYFATDLTTARQLLRSLRSVR